MTNGLEGSGRNCELTRSYFLKNSGKEEISLLMFIADHRLALWVVDVGTTQENRNDYIQISKP